MQSLRTVVVLLGIVCLAIAASYSPETAFASLYYSKIGYCQDTSIAAWNCGPSCEYHSQFKVKNVYHNGTYDAQGYSGFCPTKDRVVVAFRGSANLANWIADFNYKKMPYPDSACPGCEVHTGFYLVYLEMAGPLLKDVQQLVNEHPGKPILVTGHSLGAAVSVHAAVDIMKKIKGVSSLEVYNFGEPRVGNPAFAAWAASVLPDGKQFRVTHAADPVPHLPPMSWGFLHTPHELWYNNDGNTSFAHCDDSATSESPDCSDSTLPIDISDHTHYLGTCTECECSTYDADYYRKIKITLPMDPPTRRNANN